MYTTKVFLFCVLIFPFLAIESFASSDVLEVQIRDLKQNVLSKKTLGAEEEFEIVLQADGPRLDGGSKITDAGDLFFGFLFFDNNRFDFINLTRIDGKVIMKNDFHTDPSFDTGLGIKRIIDTDIASDAYGSASAGISYFVFGKAYSQDDNINPCEILHEETSKKRFSKFKKTNLKHLGCVGYVVTRGYNKESISPGINFPGIESDFSVPLATVKLKTKSPSSAQKTSLFGVAHTIGYNEVLAQETVAEIVIDPNPTTESRETFFSFFRRDKNTDIEMEQPSIVKVSDTIDTESQKEIRGSVKQKEQNDEHAEEEEIPLGISKESIDSASTEKRAGLWLRVVGLFSSICSSILSIF